MEVEDLTPYKKKDKYGFEYVDISSFDKALRFRKKYPVLYNPTGLLSVSYGRDFKMCAYLEVFGYQDGDWYFHLIDMGRANADSIYVADVARWSILIPKDEISKYSSFEVRRKGAPLPALIQSQDVEGAKASEYK